MQHFVFMQNRWGEGMLDQKKMLNEDLKPIIDLVKYENSIKQINAEKPVKVHLENNGKALKLICDGVELNGNLGRPLKHQLGSRIWRNKNKFSEIDTIWQDKFHKDPSGLEHQLASVFKKNDLCIRYDTDRKGKNNIYGIVTPHFIDVNQLDFRKKFIKKVEKNSKLKPISNGIIKSPYGQVIEFFEIETPGFQTTYKYGLVYAKNNGYEAYKVNWERKVLICTNGLTAWKDKYFRWKHTKKIDLDNFITNTVNDGIANQHFLEDRINASKERTLQQSMVDELISRLSLASASKNRIKNRLSIESKNVGNNEWALSQSLTWLGSHEKYVPRSVKPKLIDLGTKILENSLVGILRTEGQVVHNGNYGFLLPLKFIKKRQRIGGYN